MREIIASPQSILGEIGELISYLIKEGLVNDQNFPFLKDGEISFKKDSPISGALKRREYSQIYHELDTGRLFSVKFIDGALLQLEYLFDSNNVLLKHRLAFYPAPHLNSFQEHPEEYMIDELFLEVVQRHIIPFPIRFDFDRKNAQDVIHSACHLTLGDAKSCRIPVSAPLTPYVFLKFILMHFYQCGNWDFVENMPISNLRFDNSIESCEWSKIQTGLVISMMVPYIISSK